MILACLPKNMFFDDRDIPISNIDLHYAHCSRNLEKCKICGDMVPIKHADEHYTSTHAPVCFIMCLVCKLWWFIEVRVLVKKQKRAGLALRGSTYLKS
ncbi:hypothetical protein HanLR1_Chr05g0195081 [Helianthus annuus]|nr:hypothetical protein HanLR1_Chr05g0195081 [Helianthus annuus]